MNLATLISFGASLLLFCMGGMFVVVARAPGWQRARLFTLIAFSAALYAAVNVMFSLSGLRSETVRLTGVANFFLASVHCSAWVVVAYSSAERPWGDLPRRLKWVVGVSVLAGVLALVPGVATTSDMLVIRVPSLGVVYRQAQTTLYADTLAAAMVLLLTLPFARFLRDYRRGEPDALVRVVGFSVFFLCCIGEVLVSNGLVQFIYLGDLGFLAIVLTLLIETLRRVMRDARALELLGQDLKRQVSRRTLERDEARDALAVAERHAALGQLAAGVGHEINNPLTYIRANLEHLKAAVHAGSPPADTLELLDDALVGTKQIQRVVADLRSYSLPSVEQRQALELGDVFETALQLVSREVGPGTAVVWERSRVDPVLADPVRLRQVLVNLLLNAALAVRDAKREKPRLTLRTGMNGNAEVYAEIEDNGVGIPTSALGRLGEPYFSTRLERGGTGLGLFVARGIVDALGGRLEFESSVGRGTTARVVLPAEGQPALARPGSGPTEQVPESAAQPRRADRWRVLVVDDDPAVARAIARQLTGLDVTIAPNGRAAVERLFHGEPVDLVLCDVMMPGGSGQDVYDAVAEQVPELLRKLVFITGGATVPEVATFLRRDGVRHLPKPFERAAFDRLLADIQASRPTAPALPVAPDVRLGAG